MRFRAGLSRIYPLLIGVAVTSGMLMVGCGGGSSDPPPNPNPTATPTPTPSPTPPPANPVPLRSVIIWGPRSRQVSEPNAVSGPSSALSAIITLRRPDGSGTPFTQTVNRGVQSGRQEYTSSTTVIPGIYELSVRFFANENGIGSEVGVAAASATVLANGALSTTIATFGAVQQVVVPGGQVVNVGQTKDVVYSALNAEGNLLAITPGSAFVNLVSSTSTVSGEPSASVQGETITGINPVTAVITVRVDDAVSPATNIRVSSALNLTVTPNPADISILETQQFTANIQNDGPDGANGVTWSVKEGASAGSIDANGLFTATRNEGTFTVVARSNYDTNIVVETPVKVESKVAVTVNPNPVPNVISFKGGTQQFSATVSNIPPGQDGGVTWSIKEGSTGGTISLNGLYTTSANEGTFTIVATSRFDTRKTREVPVTVQSLVTLAVTPTNPAPVSFRGGTIRFNATVSGVPPTGDAGVTWSIEEGAAGGTITSDGTYTAGNNEGEFTVVATSNFDPRRVVKVKVTVASLVNIAVTPTNPAAISIRLGTQQFAANVTGVPSGGSTAVTWSVRDKDGNVVPNAIDANGLFRAPNTNVPNDYVVRATSVFDTRKFAEVTIPVRSFVAVDVTPNNPTPISINASRQFAVTVTGVPTGGDTSVTWSVRNAAGEIVPNVINSTGLFTAPSTPGNYRIIATSTFDDTKSGEEVITVQSGNQPVIIR